MEALNFAHISEYKTLHGYLHNRAFLGNYKSRFHCVPNCNRPGCKEKGMQVPVSLIDLIGAAAQWTAKAKISAPLKKREIKNFLTYHYVVIYYPPNDWGLHPRKN